jgi:hypothetical protein
MRGAAMKVGQLLSMDSGEILPAPLTEILASLREEAHQMPLGQVGEDPAVYRRQVIGLLNFVSEPLCHDYYEFGNSDLVSRISSLLAEIRLKGEHGRLPPPDILFLHRKLGGLYLLLARLKAQIGVREMVQRYVE